MRMSFTSRTRDPRARVARRLVEQAEPVEPAATAAESGEVADQAADPSRPVQARGWYASSLELRHGLEVSDVPLDTLPDDLISGFTKW